jgi:hypothetical protein
VLEVGDLVGGHAVRGGHHHGPRLLGRQGGERVAQLAGGLTGEGPLLRALGRADQVRVPLGQIEGQVEGSGPTDPDRVHREVVGDAGQPDAHRAPPGVITVGGPPGPLERRLGDVLGQPGVTGEAERDAEHGPLEPAYERQRELGVSGGETRQQNVIGPVGDAGTHH